MVDHWRPHSADDYTQTIVALYPPGWGWEAFDGSDESLWAQGFAVVWGDPFDTTAAKLLVVESDPRQTVDLLPDWERNWGLPDPCLDEVLSIGDRQIALVTKMTLIGGSSRQFFIDLAATLGYTINFIREYSPYVTGISKCGDVRDENGFPRWQLGPGELRFWWNIHIGATRLTWFRTGAGGGQCGIDPLLRIALATDLECLFRRYKPAHTNIIFDYAGLPSPILTPFAASLTLSSSPATMSTLLMPGSASLAFSTSAPTRTP